MITAAYFGTLALLSLWQLPPLFQGGEKREIAAYLFLALLAAGLGVLVFFGPDELGLADWLLGGGG